MGKTYKYRKNKPKASLRKRTMDEESATKAWAKPKISKMKDDYYG